MPTNTAPVTSNPHALPDLDRGARDLTDIRVRGTSDREQLGLHTYVDVNGRLVVVGPEYKALITLRTTGNHTVVRVTKDTGRTRGVLETAHMSPFDIAALAVSLVD